MFLSSLPTRLASYQASMASTFVLRRALTPVTTRNFSMSRVILAATAIRKEPINTTAKKTSNRKEDKEASKPRKTAAKKEAEKKRVIKKPVKKIKITSEQKPPKRPAGSYALFFREQFATIDHSNDADKRNIIPRAAKSIAEKWKLLSDHEKQRYNDEYEKAKEVYNKKREEYFKTVDPAILKEINKRRTAKGKSKIRAISTNHKPLTPFFQFLADQRKDDTFSSGSGALERAREFAKDCGEKWRTMSDEEKKPYVNRYAEAKKEYEASLST